MGKQIMSNQPIATAAKVGNAYYRGSLSGDLKVPGGAQYVRSAPKPRGQCELWPSNLFCVL